MARKCAGSQMGHLTFHQNRFVGHNILMAYYFVSDATYPAYLFRRCFGMFEWLFRRIVDGMEANEPFFKHRRNVAGLLGFSCFRKVTAALRMVAYGTPAAMKDKYLRTTDNTIIKCTKVFADTMVRVLCELSISRTWRDF